MHRIQQGDPSTATPRPFPLPHLPAELRNRIYEFILSSSSSPFTLERPDFLPSITPDRLVLSSAVCRHQDLDEEQLKPRYREPALLRTCRQIRAEVLPPHYSKRAFMFMTTTQLYRRSLRRRLRRIGEDGRAALRHTVLRGLMVIDGLSIDDQFHPASRPRPLDIPHLHIFKIYFEISIRLQEKLMDPLYCVEGYAGAFYFWRNWPS